MMELVPVVTNIIDWTPILTNLVIGIFGGGTLTTGVALALLHGRKGSKDKPAQEAVLKDTGALPIPPMTARTDDDRSLIKSLERRMMQQDEDMAEIREEFARTRGELADTRQRLAQVEHSLSHVRRDYNRLHKRALNVIIHWSTVRKSETPPKLLDELEPPE